MYFDTSLKTSRVDLSALSQSVTDEEETTIGVQIEEQMCTIRSMQMVTKLWVSVRKSDRDGCRVSLTCFSCKDHDSCGRNKSHQFKFREGTQHCSPSYRSCENDWRSIMSDTLKFSLKKGHPIHKHLMM